MQRPSLPEVASSTEEYQDVVAPIESSTKSPSQVAFVFWVVIYGVFSKLEVGLCTGQL